MKYIYTTFLLLIAVPAFGQEATDPRDPAYDQSGDEQVDGWPVETRGIRYTSSADGSLQPAMWYEPLSDEPVPLLVGLHTWGGSYTNLNGVPYAELAMQKGWAFIFPNFRGANNKPEATGSDFVVGDILSAVEYAEQHANIDPSRIYLVGASGGGHAALLMAGRAPWRWSAVSAWVPITDLAAWHTETLTAGLKYFDDLEKSCGGAPGSQQEVDVEYERRSPLTYLSNARPLQIEISAGIRDGHNGAAVPVSHALHAFNVLADPDDQLTEEEVDYFRTQAQVPPHLQMTVEDTTYTRFKPLFRRQSSSVRLTVFDGAHNADAAAAVAWLEQQIRSTSSPTAAPTEPPTDDLLVSRPYPNPVAGAVTLPFEIASTRPVTVRLFNQLGQELAVLADAVYPAGRHELRWDAAPLSSGVYFYRVEAGDALQTGSMIVAR